MRKQVYQSTRRESYPFGNHRYSLDKYLNDISSFQLLSAQDEIELTKRIRQNDSEALEKLVQSNLRFVVKIAKEYQNQGLPLADLINEGNLGLIKAAKRFDETRGFKFISYGVWWIRQSILKALAEHSRVVRLPLNRLGAITKINQAIRCFEQEHKRAPTLHEISSDLNIPITEVTLAMSTSAFHTSIDQTPNHSDNGSLKDFLKNPDAASPDGELIKESLRGEIQRVLKTLSSREQKIIKMYFGINYERPYTLEEIGEQLKLTRERVRQLKERALSRLRHQSRSQNLRSFL